MLLWCSLFNNISATEAEEDIYPDPGHPPPWSLYVIVGTDARGFAFKITFGWEQGEYYRSTLPNPNRVLRQEKDDDLRSKDQIQDLLFFEDVYLGYIDIPDKSPSLHGIVLQCEDRLCIKITGRGESELNQYPKDGKRTLISDLLDTNTTMIAIDKLQSIVDEYGITEGACDIIKAELEKEYPPLPTPAWVLPTAICGGAVVLAAAVAIPTVIIHRKKRGGVEDTVETAPSSV
jgi:hypothetical protein